VALGAANKIKGGGVHDSCIHRYSQYFNTGFAPSQSFAPRGMEAPVEESIAHQAGTDAAWIKLCGFEQTPKPKHRRIPEPSN